MKRASLPHYDINSQRQGFISPKKPDHIQKDLKTLEEVDLILSKLADLTKYFTNLRTRLSNKLKDTRNRLSVPTITEEDYYEDWSVIEGLQIPPLKKEASDLADMISELQKVLNFAKPDDLSLSFCNNMISETPRISEMGRLTSFGNISEILFDPQQTGPTLEKTQSQPFPSLQRMGSSHFQEKEMQQKPNMLLKDISPINALDNTVAQPCHDFGDALTKMKKGVSSDNSEGKSNANETVNSFYCAGNKADVAKEVSQEEQETVYQTDFSFELKQEPLKMKRHSTEGSVLKDSETILYELERKNSSKKGCL